MFDLKTVNIAKYILEYVRMEYRVGRFMQSAINFKAVHIFRQNVTFRLACSTFD